VSALERYDVPGVLLDTTDVAQDIAIRRLSEWATSAQAAHGVATELVRTSFVPEAFRNKPYEATAAILSGLEMGLSPMASLRSFDIIQGQAAPRAITLRAVAQAHGHTLILEESTATRCRMRGKRAGEHEWQSVTWTIDRARALELTGKRNWKLQPQAMLLARATSELARLVAADAILGIAYSAEEIADGAVGEPPPPLAGDVAEDGPPASEVVQATAGTKRMSRKKAAPPAAEEPAPASEDAPQDDDLPERTGPTERQTKRVMAMFGELGLAERGARLERTSAIVGRDVSSWNEVTADEADQVIDALRVQGLRAPVDDDYPPHPGDAA
jgi:hypothetical protein